MGDRGHIDMGRQQGGLLCPFRRGSWVPLITECGMGRDLIPYPDLHPSSRLATIDMGRKLGAVPLLGAGAATHLTQRRLGRGLPQYQVAS